MEVSPSQRVLLENTELYCADHSHDSDQAKQETMDIAALLSRLAMKSGVGFLTLAEYAKCKR